MSKFERPEAALSKLETGEVYEQLKEEINKEAIELKKRGFEVDEECRIKPEMFEGIVPHEKILKDLEKVKILESHFKEQETTITETQEKGGESLEMVKTLGFNKHWFGGRFVAVRTSKYDDYFNGVDNLIIDNETFEPLAAIDTTTNYLIKAKAGKIKEKLENGCEVKYGFGLTKEGVVEKSYKKLPLFIISIGRKELNEILEEGKFSEIEDYLLRTLKLQSENFPKQPLVDQKVKDSYKRFEEIFKQL